MALFSSRRKPRLAVVSEPEAPARPLAERALEHVDELYGLARHLCGNPSDAEDLVQDTYARALAARFDENGHLRAWLFRILRNCFIDQARRRQVVLELPDDTLDAHVEEPVSLEQLRYLTSAELARAIATLPIELRFVLLLDVEGFTEAEVADIVRCAPGTVKSRLSRAKAKLREALRGKT
jgi:RNA polymerase sigma-70 factor (ECF subfamily)